MGRGRGEHSELEIGDDLAEAIAAAGVSQERAESIAQLARPALRIIPEQEADSRSFFGGAPLVPKGFLWPRDQDGFPLGFIAQLDLSELPHEELQGAEGILYFFYDGRGWKNDQHTKPAEIIYLAEPGELQEAEQPAEIAEGHTETYSDNYSYHTRLLYPRLPLRFERFLSTPDYQEVERLTGGPLGEDNDPYFDWLNEHARSTHQLLGYADPVQNDVPAEIAYHTQGLDQEWRDADMELRLKEFNSFTYSDERVGDPAEARATREEAAGKIEDERQAMEEHFKQRVDDEAANWRLFLQIDSAAPFEYWGDGGTLYLMIRDEDLRRRDFSQMVFIKQE